MINTSTEQVELMAALNSEHHNPVTGYTMHAQTADLLLSLVEERDQLKRQINRTRSETLEEVASYVESKAVYSMDAIEKATSEAILSNAITVSASKSYHSLAAKIRGITKETPNDQQTD